MTEKGTGGTCVSQSTVVVAGPALLWGIIPKASGANKELTVYDGQDGSSGVRKVVVGTQNGVTHPVIFSKPVRMDTGIYIEIESGIDYVFVQWEPLHP